MQTFSNFKNIVLKQKKVFLINFLILFIFIFLPGFLLLGIERSKSILYSISKKPITPRADSPLFISKDQAYQLFLEVENLKMKYKSFIGWRPEPVKMKYVNISKLYNNRISTGEKLNNSTWFFGGSTTWGYGTPDWETIPSLYNKKTGNKVFNFGEQGWVSRQSLNQLISAIGDGNKPSAVIFYSGVNDMSVGCDIKINNFPYHARQMQISKKLENVNLQEITTDFITRPYIKILNKLYFTNDLMVPNSQHACHKNKKRAQLVANHLVQNWYVAYLVSKSNNAKFYAVLQPNIITSNSTNQNFNHVKNIRNSFPRYKLEVNAVYPLIVSKVKSYCDLDLDFCNSFIDGRNWITNDYNVFIDTNHLVKEGNQIIVENLIKSINILEK
tara:strand:- start:7144 stop:8301 length:1158 start_codon:yes stop_codon:yes gene_type:complete